HAGLLNKAVEAQQSGRSAVGVNGGDSARVPSVPRFQQRERLTASNLADDDAVRAKPHRDSYQPRQIGYVTGVELNRVACFALELARILQDDNPLGGITGRDDLADQSVGKRGLARRRSAGNDDVAPVTDSIAEYFELAGRHDAGLRVVIEAVDLARQVADDERRC